MTAARRLNRISVADYLAGELVSPVKHEYVAGMTYAMAGGLNRHNHIAGNTFGAMYVRLRGKPCQPFNSDTKIRIQLPGEVRFYYPETSVVCRPNPDDDSFQDEPVVLFEVLFTGTRRIDEGEKKDAYFTIPSLAVYVLIEQAAPSVVAWRRTPAGFAPETYEGLDAVLALPEIDTRLPLAEIYASIQFPAPPES